VAEQQGKYLARVLNEEVGTCLAQGMNAKLLQCVHGMQDETGKQGKEVNREKRMLCTWLA
jgi:hypothetical protein